MGVFTLRGREMSISRCNSTVVVPMKWNKVRQGSTLRKDKMRAHQRQSLAAVRVAMQRRKRAWFTLVEHFLVVCSLIASGFFHPVTSSAQAAEAEPTVLSEEEDLAESLNPDVTEETDELLDLDLEALAQTPVLVSTTIDPVVESVSKNAEKSSDSPAIVQVITAKEIEQFGAKNLFEVLNWATSVYTTGSYLYPDNSVSMRGDLLTHNDNHRLVLINGRPFRDVLESGLNSSIYLAFPVDAIDHVEIIRGPGSVLYGSNAFSGVINVVTKKPIDSSSRGAALAGSFGTQKYDLSQGNGNDQQGYLISATYGRQEGWPFTATGEGPPVQNPAVTDSVLRGYEDVGMFAQFYRGGFTVNTFVASTSQTHLGALPIWPAGDLGMDRVFVDAAYAWEHSPESHTHCHFTYNFLGHQWQRPTPINATAHSYLFEVEHYREINEDLDLLIGGTTDFHEGESEVVAPFTEIWYGVYGQLEYTPTEWLKLVAGIQGNMPGEVTGGVAPRASAIFTLTDQWGAKLLYGEAFRSPYSVERTVNAPGQIVGNPNLSPETVSTYEAQLSHTTSQSRIAATYFYSEYNDLITRTPTFPVSFQNSGTLTFQGVELESVYDLREKWHLLGAVTWQQNVNDADQYDTTLVPNWMGKFGVAHKARRLETGLFYIAFSKPNGVPAVNPGAAVVNTPESDIHLLSCNATYNVSEWIGSGGGPTAKLHLLTQNLLDDDINHPEFGRRRINTLPAGAGLGLFGGISLEY